MKQVSVTLSTYTADVSGVCSALYELGGMVVIHDPSGCNSTYNTHDEPRWYDMDSLVFISGLSQMDAIMGNDDKFINDMIWTSPGCYKAQRCGFIIYFFLNLKCVFLTDLIGE